MNIDQGIVAPDIPEGKAVDLSDDQLRQIWDRIQIIEQHFSRCCAFQQDSCHYNEDYNQLYGYLHLAGLDSWKTPFDQAEFDEWMASRQPAGDGER